MTLEQMQEQLVALQAENAALKASKDTKGYKLTMRVSEKGAVSVYGLGRFPVTLYAAQWNALLDQADTIREFAKLHEAELTAKSTANDGKRVDMTAKKPVSAPNVAAPANAPAIDVQALIAAGLTPQQLAAMFAVK
jgi:hypothetical protein